MEDKIPLRNVFVKDEEVEVKKSLEELGGEGVGDDTTGWIPGDGIGGDLAGGTGAGGDLK